MKVPKEKGYYWFRAIFPDRLGPWLVVYVAEINAYQAGSDKPLRLNGQWGNRVMWPSANGPTLLSDDELKEGF